MSRHEIQLADIVVASGQTNSNALLANEDPIAPNMATGGGGFRDGDAITIIAPTTLAEVATVHVAEKEVGGTFQALQRNGADVVVAAAKAVTIEGISFKAIRITLGVVAAATRTFKVVKGVRVYG